MSDEQKLAIIDRLPPDLRAMANSMLNLITLYFPDREQIEMYVGRNTKATLKFEGGPITREVIEDTMAHLAFYKKYFPKDPIANPLAIDTPEKVLDALVAAWETHREMMREQGLSEAAPISDPPSPMPENPSDTKPPPVPEQKTTRHYRSTFEPT